MRIWRHFKTIRGAAGATSALIAIAFGLIVLIDVRARWHADATNAHDFWHYIALDLVFGVAPLISGLVALWRGSLVILVAAWAFTAGLSVADFIKLLTAVFIDAKQPLHFGDVTNPAFLIGTMPFWLSGLGLLLAWMAIKRTSRQPRTEQSPS